MNQGAPERNSVTRYLPLSVVGGVSQDEEALHAMSDAATARVAESGDFVESIYAFAEKRAPARECR